MYGFFILFYFLLYFFIIFYLNINIYTYDKKSHGKYTSVHIKYNNKKYGCRTQYSIIKSTRKKKKVLKFLYMFIIIIFFFSIFGTHFTPLTFI